MRHRTPILNIKKALYLQGDFEHGSLSKLGPTHDGKIAAPVVHNETPPSTQPNDAPSGWNPIKAL